MNLIDRVAYRLKLRDLRLLETVVRLRSMRKAATQLNISQPAVSKAIAELEYMVGVRLVDRGGQGVEPTEYGRALLACGVAVFDDLRQGLRNIELLVDPTAGEVRIGSTNPIAASFVSAVVDQIVRRHPRIVFHVVTAQTDELHRALQDRKVDLLIARNLSAAEERQSFEFLFEDLHVIATGLGNPLVRRRRLKLSDLMGESWVLPPPDSPAGLIAVEAFHASGLDYPAATVFAVSPEVRMSMLASGRFITIFPTSELRFSPRPLVFKALPVELPHARVPIGAITLRQRTISPVATLFISHAREMAKLPTKQKS